MASEDPLYEQIAHDLTHSIQQGTLRPGARLPSVRSVAERRGVSVATAVAAYSTLEGQGWIEARPRSGFFVRQRPISLSEPRPARRNTALTSPSVSSAVAALQSSMRDPSLVPLGSAWIAPEVLPIVQLNRILASIARQIPHAGATYESSPGLLVLRQQIARRAAATGNLVHPEDVIITVGATEAISLALAAVTKPGDTVAVESPTYFGLLQALEDRGLRALEIPAKPQTGLDLEALQDALQTTKINAVLVVLNASNPLGAVMPEANREQLVQMLAKHDVPLIEDDVYGDLIFEGPRPRSAQSFDREGRVLLCNSISKTMASGYRIGWILPGKYGGKVQLRQFAHTLACPTLPQMAVAEMLASGGYERHLRRLRQSLITQIAQLRAAIGERFPEGTRVSSPLGGFVLWVELPQAVSALRLQADALEKGISIAPGPIFSARDRFSNCIRLSCGQPWSPRIDQAISTLASLINHQLACKL
jgi:DNA-binding transcriptional MocR family regulator